MTAVRPAPGPRAAARGRRRSAREERHPILNRELSWLEFNARVLHEAGDERNPLLDRVRSLFFFVNNLDEFFQVRVSGLRRQELSGSQALSADGRTAADQLDAIRARVVELMAEQGTIFANLHRELAAEGIAIVDYDDVPDHHDALRQRFHDEIYPVLTPLAVDPGHPFPYISTLTLSIAVGLRDPDTGEQRFARVKIPPLLPRLVQVDPGRFVLLDQIIEANLDELFRGMEILETHLFRVTRDADIAIEEDEADDLLLAIEEEVRRRRFGEAVRLEVERSMPEVTRRILSKGVGVLDDDVYEVAGMLDLTALWQLVDLDRPDLKAPPYTPVIPPRLTPDEDGEPVDLFAQIRAGDLLVHHPYESFTASVERFIAQAADDPDVLTIKQTLYRTSGDSPDRPGPDPRRGARQAGRGAGRDQGALRRGGQHRVGPPPRAGGRPRRLRPRRPQDPLEGGAGRAPRGHRAAPLRAHRDRQLQLEDRALVRRTSGSCRAARSSARTPRTCSTRSRDSRASACSAA